ncbi:hypothetical protein TWF694_004775 [Orbilia ellipsospora]|uniref:Uncharacterized protein n=1 Tax=Orbilia ellipsospora TaxID=2528407 RepID=A0AAV9WW43_9PEZI
MLPLLLALFTPQTLACLHLSATVHSGLGSTASLTIVDNGVTVCDGRLSGCAGVISCSTSPTWNWAYLDMCHNSFNKGPRVQYQNDHGKWEWDGIPGGDCDVWNCCGGDAPCGCQLCTYDMSEWC